MKLYYHPVSTTSRPIVLFAAECGIPLDLQVVDLMKGEHVQPAYTAINPNKLVPVLEDGEFRLTESSTILKYLAEKIGSPAYPKDLKQRARVNEMMDWVNTQMCRDFAYGFVYPQIFPNNKRPDETVQKGTIEWGREKSAAWLKVMDEKLLGAGKNYLCGEQITVADYFAASFVSLAEVIRCDLSKYPNLKRWFDNMKTLKNWAKVHEVFYGMVGAYKDAKFQVV